MKNPTSINLRITRKNDYTDDEGDSAGEFDDYDGNVDVGRWWYWWWRYYNYVGDYNGGDDGHNESDIWGTDDGEGDEKDESNKDVHLDNANAVDGRESCYLW